MIEHDFLERYHADNAAITEDLLAPARDDAGRDPYTWLVEGLRLGAGAAGVVLDLACGSAPVADRLPSGGPGYVGVDVSEAELAQARARRPQVEVHLAPAHEAAGVVAGRAVAGVSISMALMLLDLDAVLAPLREITNPGTRLAAIVPTRDPSAAEGRGAGGRGADDFRGLLAELGALGVPFPEPLEPGDTADRLEALGWRLLRLEEQTFARPVASAEDVDTVARSFYTPGSAAARVAVRERLNRLRHGSGQLPYPLRRLVAERL